MDYKLLNRNGVVELLGISLDTLGRLRKQGGSPKPLVIEKRLRWRDCDIQAWLDQKLMDSEAE